MVLPGFSTSPPFSAKNLAPAHAKESMAAPRRNFIGPFGMMFSLFNASADQSTLGRPNTMYTNRETSNNATMNFCTFAEVLRPIMFTTTARVSAPSATNF